MLIHANGAESGAPLAIFTLLLLAAGLFSLPAASEGASKTYEPAWESLNSRPTPEWFSDAKFGVFIHWGVYAVPSYGPKQEYAENYAYMLYQVKREAEVEFHKRVYGADFPYKDFAPMFKAELFDPAAWADVLARSGARYVVLTSKHTDSFCLWPAPDSNHWNSVEAGPKRDLCGELTEAVRARGLRMGFYYCLLEWYHPFSTLYKDNVDAYVETRLLPQLKDLVSRYKPSIVWGDGEWDHSADTWRSREFLAWLFNEAPNREYVAVNDRWDKGQRHKNGGYYTTEYGAGLKDTSHPWEECRAIGHSFGYNRNESLEDYRPAGDLVLMLVDLVSRSGTLLLDIGPTADGRIPVIMEERLLQMGQWLEVNGPAIYATRPWKESCQWSTGVSPEIEFGKTYRAKYDITDITGTHDDGRAVVEAFFTVRDGKLYAITPGWPGEKLTLSVPEPPKDAAVTLLGHTGPLPWRYEDGILVIPLSGIEPSSLPCQWAYAFEIAGLVQ